MIESSNQKIVVSAVINADIHTAWSAWTEPAHIIQWNFASEDWHTPTATNDLRAGGRFTSRMEAKDGSMGFDFGGQYEEVVALEKIVYSLDDGRRVEIVFETDGDMTTVTESFDPENENPAEMQKAGWQAIMDNYKKYTESL